MPASSESGREHQYHQHVQSSYEERPRKLRQPILSVFPNTQRKSLFEVRQMQVSMSPYRVQSNTRLTSLSRRTARYCDRVSCMELVWAVFDRSLLFVLELPASTLVLPQAILWCLGADIRRPRRNTTFQSETEDV